MPDDLITLMQQAVDKMSYREDYVMPTLFIGQGLYDQMKDAHLIDFDNDTPHGITQIPMW